MTDLERIYWQRFEQVLTPLATELHQQLASYLEKEPRIDRIAVRPKSISRFLGKATKEKDGVPKYDDPINQIQDQIGARIVTFYLSDVSRVSEIIKKYYRAIESKDIVPESEWEFGYFGRHYVLLTPTDLLADLPDRSVIPPFFELQIKTLFQHAWSEAEHDLGYKPGATRLGADENRRLAFTSAQAWGADRMFDELFQARANDEDTPKSER